MKRLLVLVTAALSLGACSIVPEPIQLAEGSPLVSFNQIIDDPSGLSVVGEKARWGGRIVGVQNKQDASEIEVIFFPEASNGKPRTGEESKGRFKAIVPGFVDPLVFEKDRLITIVGDVAAPETGIIGEQNYIYPTLSAMGYYMWKQSTDVEVQNIGFQPFGYGMPFYRSAWGSLYSPWHSGFHRSRIRVISNNGHSQGSSVQPPAKPSSPSAPVSSPGRPTSAGPAVQKH